MVRSNKLQNYGYTFFTFVLLCIPSFALIAFSNDTIVASTLKKIIFPLFSSSFILLFFAFIRPRLVLLFFIPIFLLSFIEIYTIYTLKTATSSGVIASILMTNKHEAHELLSSNLSFIIGAVISLGIYLFITLHISKSFVLHRNLRKMIIIAFIGIQFSVIARDIYIAHFIVKNNSFSSTFITVRYNYFVKLEKCYPINWVININHYLEGVKELNQYTEKIKDFKFNAHLETSIDDREIYVMLIGESARRSNFSLYGYPRKTNPLLEKRTHLIKFEDVKSVSNLTGIVYPLFLSRATPTSFERSLNEPSISQVFREAGFKTFYISNQAMGHGSIFHLYAQQADSLIQLESSLTKQYTDNEIFEPFNRIINMPENNKVFIIIHTVGSHFRYNLRYPKYFEYFKPNITSSLSITSFNKDQKEAIVNSYDNSILFTDYVINELIETLDKQHAVSSLMYASDHGENLLDQDTEMLGHGTNSPTAHELEIPLLIWYSDKYKSSFPVKLANMLQNTKSPVSTNAFFHTMVDIAGISIDEETSERSVANKNFKAEKNRAILSPSMEIKYEEY